MFKMKLVEQTEPVNEMQEGGEDGLPPQENQEGGEANEEQGDAPAEQDGAPEGEAQEEGGEAKVEEETEGDILMDSDYYDYDTVN